MKVKIKMMILVKRIFLFLLLACLSSVSVSTQDGTTNNDPLKLILGQHNFGSWQQNETAAGAPEPSNDPTELIVLAANRTRRPDILRGFKRYHDGWNITNQHYWASVGFTGAAGFILAAVWFIFFGLALVIHHFCGWKICIAEKGSYRSQMICLILLILFTCAAAVGSILLSVGQDNFHSEVLHTLNYVVNQSEYTVETLRNVTEYLSLAKTIRVAQIFLPSDVMDGIDKLNVDLNSAADKLTEKTDENDAKIRKVFNAVRLALIVMAAAMLVLTLLGLLLSILGHQHAIHIFIVTGWLLVAITFVLCGVFVIFNKKLDVISDTCMAMDEWVDHPHAETALSNILPCVDQRATNQTLFQSKQVITDIVNVINQFIYTYADINPSEGATNYYNQSGPFMPPLCYPFDTQLKVRECAINEVSMANASSVWQNYTCKVAESGICTTMGRITPQMYEQLVGAVTESYALEHYAPPLLSLQNCDFVRDTFQNITSRYCPPLIHHLKIVNTGLGLISVGVLLCLVLWILYANRPQREEAIAKFSLPVKRNFETFKSVIVQQC